MSATTTVQVAVPAMGESVSEGTILEWHKREGDAIATDETLVEISTDKVDAEVPSPAAGTVTRILVEEGETVAVGTIIAEIDTNGAAPSGNGGGPAAATSAPEAPPVEAPTPQPSGQTVEIVMPPMGESVSEGVVLEWAKAVGGSVAADEPIVEISTDKVDAEVPSPASGTLTE
ncbi:MAG TPA: biotin/lipoyl-containing protein, partial [Solirubrobacteraceae bacterium]